MECQSSSSVPSQMETLSLNLDDAIANDAVEFIEEQDATSAEMKDTIQFCDELKKHV